MPDALEIYNSLNSAYGPAVWWSDDAYTVMVEAILVQNTTWSSVVKVIKALPQELTPLYISSLADAELESLIRPCGFAKRKSMAIIRITDWFRQSGYDVEKVAPLDKDELRNRLLSIKGIGNETADVISVYAFHKPIFIVDTYSRRLLMKLGFNFENDGEIKIFFGNGLQNDYHLYGWIHWLILQHGIKHCKKKPLCHSCIFKDECTFFKSIKSQGNTAW